MDNIIYIYFTINAFIAGYTFKDTYKWEPLTKTILYTLFAVLFGFPLYLILLIFYSFVPIFGWLFREIRFQYRLCFTKYWDKIMLDDNYSPIYKTLKEKLERADKLTKNGSKQLRRHNRQIINKYGNE